MLMIACRGRAARTSHVNLLKLSSTPYTEEVHARASRCSTEPVAPEAHINLYSTASERHPGVLAEHK